MELNSKHEGLLQRALEAGVGGNFDSSDVQTTREGLADLSRSLEEHLLHMMATMAATHHVEHDFQDTTRGVDTGLFLMSQALQ